ncbi:hypothetical protein GCM10010844_29270 [Deinococcus radiotolerans]|uniref:Uncharacterized protein n=1 Tax=Deinococcus radiotolerans TaxID=1309407 RepID=A0ABQ2FN02_9DEIO|nr:hypothetical protein GCM10010844_29270 [Deinococcus radiotolerans]
MQFTLRGTPRPGPTGRHRKIFVLEWMGCPELPVDEKAPALVQVREPSGPERRSGRLWALRFDAGPDLIGELAAAQNLQFITRLDDR